MILLTGALGFIGSHLADRLPPTAIYCDPKDIFTIPPDRCLQFLNTAQQEIDCIFHLGAISSTAETNVATLTQNNILLSCQLLDFCIDRQVPFVYASSASVYGLGENGFNEETTPTPLNYYAISKTAFDMYVLQKIKDHPDAHIVGLRYFNVYGKNESHKGNMASPIYKFLQQAKILGEIKIFEGSDHFVRDFVHVDDAVSITLAAKDFKKSGIYNVGTGTPRSFLEVAQIIAKHTGARIIEAPFPIELRGKYQEFTCSDNTKINAVGYNTERISLEAGIQQVMNE
jgi:ADP-L-glycero-D-manno-heptose 6-epimerase